MLVLGEHVGKSSWRGGPFQTQIHNAVATAKHISAHRTKPFATLHFGKFGARFESIIAEFGQCFRHFHHHHIGATLESADADLGNLVGDSDRAEALAAIKGATLNFGEGVWQGYRC